MLWNTDPLILVLSIPGLLLAFTVHEYGHAMVADWFGDPTPRLMGRTSLEPWKHIDPMGAILLLFAGFGWAKPVLTNPSRYRNRYWGDLAVSLAGVTMNFLTALVLAAIMGLMYRFDLIQQQMVANLFRLAIAMNLGLAAFNLLPVPPLDGWHVVRRLLPGSAYNFVHTVERMGFLLMMLIIVTPVANILLIPLRSGLELAVMWVFTLAVR